MKQLFIPRLNLIVLCLVALLSTLEGISQKELLGLTEDQKRVILSTSNRAEYYEKLSEIRSEQRDNIQNDLDNAIEQLNHCKQIGELTAEIEASYTRQIEELKTALKTSEKQLKRAKFWSKVKNWIIAAEAGVIVYFYIKQ